MKIAIAICILAASCTSVHAARSRIVAQGNGFIVREITLEPSETYHQPARGARVVCWLNAQHKAVGKDTRTRSFGGCDTFPATTGSVIVNKDKTVHRSLIIEDQP